MRATTLEEAYKEAKAFAEAYGKVRECGKSRG